MGRLTAIILLLYLSVLCGGSAARVPQLRRHKRDWVIPATRLKENFDYTGTSHVSKIRSDKAKGMTLHYSLTGPGANMPPVNVFIVGETTGFVYVRGKLDREKRPNYTLIGEAGFGNGSVAEAGIALNFEVVDDNDNPPVFQPVPPATVKESSPAGTLVAVVTATDADLPNSDHTKISYSILKQEPSNGTNFFSIDRHTGRIYVKENTLDREKQSSYLLTIKGTDLDGHPNGNTGTGTVLVKVLDINDNKPALDKDEYSASIKENTEKMEVMRFKVLDDDEKKTDNYNAVFDIVSGNDDGIFSIKTDPNTNEGILVLEKPVDFEQNPDIKLGVVVANVAPFVGDGGGDGGGGGGGAGGGGGGGGGGGAGAGGAGAGGGGAGGGGGGAGGGGGGAGGGGGGAGGGGGGGGGGAGAGAGTGATGAGAGKPTTNRPKGGKVYSVNIAVQNEPEGAVFKPATKPLSVSENPKENPLNEVIGVFRATDADSGKPAENVRYAKGYDPDNWLMIDPETAEIRLQKFPDRESPHVVNGTYYAKIISLSQDEPLKISTGTIALQVGDVNDNCPSMVNRVEYVCTDTEVVNVTAVDEDGDPNSAPLSFSVVTKESRGEWSVEPVNETSASLRALSPLWAGHYKLVLLIKDKQGLACPEPQHLDIHVCSCVGGETCKHSATSLRESSSTFGGLGIGALILGLLTLLIVGLLLMSCSCGGVSGVFSDLPFDTRDHLINYHTEGRGEDRDVPLLRSPVQITPGAITAAQANNVAYFMSANMGVAMSRAGDDYMIQQRSLAESRESWAHTQYSTDEQLLQYKDIALPDEFLAEYYSQKAGCASALQAGKDYLARYEFEGQGSSAGSVGCCSILESADNLQFLDDLGPKFKTLADICSPPRPPTPVPRQSIVIPQVEEVKHIAGPSLETKPLTIHSKSSEQNQNISISQSSTRVMGFNGAASSSVHGQFSHNVLSRPQSPPVRPVATAMLPSPPVAPAMLPSSGQILLVQQQKPVYYTTSPVMQPMHYVVQPQLQSTVLLAGAPVNNMQGMVLVNGGSGHAGNIMHGGNAAGTLTLGRSHSVIEENQGVGLQQRSDRSGEVMHVRRSHGSGQRVEVGEYCNTGTLIDGQLQSTVLLAGAPVNNLQGMVLVNGGSGHAGNIMHGGNAAGTLTLGRRRGSSAIEENQGVGLQQRSDRFVEVMDVRRSDGSGQRVEVGEYCNTGMLIDGHISEGTAGHKEVALTQRGKKKRRTRSTALVLTKVQKDDE